MSNSFAGMVIMTVIWAISGVVSFASDKSNEIEPEEYVMLRAMVAEYPEELTEVHNKYLEDTFINGDERDILIHRWERLRDSERAQTELIIP